MRLVVALCAMVLCAVALIPSTLAQTPAQLAESDTLEAQKMFKEYVGLFLSKRYEDALGLLLSRTKAGDKWARKALGDLFFSAPPEMERLRDAWVNRAARQGDADAQFLLGYTLMDKLFRQRDVSHDAAYYRRLAEAVSWMDKAADQGHQDAIGTLSGFNGKKFEPHGIRSKHFAR